MEMKSLLRANWDRALAIALVVAGVVMLIVGWFGVSRTGLVAEQNPYLISAGLGGIAVIAIGCTVWMSADLQDEWRRIDRLEELLEQLFSASTPGAGEPRATGTRSRTSSRPRSRAANRDAQHSAPQDASADAAR